MRSTHTTRSTPTTTTAGLGNRLEAPRRGSLILRSSTVREHYDVSVPCLHRGSVLASTAWAMSSDRSCARSFRSCPRSTDLLWADGAPYLAEHTHGEPAVKCRPSNARGRQPRTARVRTRPVCDRDRQSRERCPRSLTSTGRKAAPNPTQSASHSDHPERPRFHAATAASVARTVTENIEPFDESALQAGLELNEGSTNYIRLDRWVVSASSRPRACWRLDPATGI